MIRSLKYIILLLLISGTCYARTYNYHYIHKQYNKNKVIIDSMANKYGLSKYLIMAIITQESNWHVKAKGKYNCNGLMQVQGGSFKPDKAVMQGCKILNYNLSIWNGNLGMALTAYQRGNGGANKYYRKHRHISPYACKVIILQYNIESYFKYRKHISSII